MLRSTLGSVLTYHAHVSAAKIVLPEVVKRETEDCGTSDRSLCNVHEYVTVKLSRNYLLSKRASGFNAKLWDRRESVVVFVPPDFIEGLLARMENRAPQTANEISAATRGPVPASPASGSSGRR